MSGGQLSLLYLLLIAVGSTNGQIQAIKDAAADTSTFWFGDDYGIRCPGGNSLVEIDCYNPLEVEGMSIATLVNAGTDISDNLDKELTVSYTSPAGSYTGCGASFEFPQVEFDLDPLSPPTTSHTPWEMRNEPKITWTLDSGKQYTLLVSNVGFGVLQALYMNVDTLELTSKAVLPYRGPRDIRAIPTPVVYFLFEQVDNDIPVDPAWLQRFNDTFVRLDITEFALIHGLNGPVAMTWGQVGFDAYAAGLQKQEGFVDNCPTFVHEALLRDQNRPFLPADINLKVNVEIEFHSPRLTFTSCCTDYAFEEETFPLNPVGSEFVKASSTRTDDTTRKFTLTARKIKPDPEVDFPGTWWTLLMVDPDTPNTAIGTIQTPLVHWLITDIQDGVIDGGKEIHFYRGPLPPDQLPHTYYYLLLKQTGQIGLTDSNKYANNGNCGEGYQGRCLFDVSYFMEDNNLSLDGITWMVSGNDAFVNQTYIERGREESELCEWTPGYDDPCPVNSATVPLTGFVCMLLTFLFCIFGKL